MKRDIYYHGEPGKKYGIYNASAKCFQFGVSEDTPMLAEARLYQKIGDDAKKHKFEPRELPKTAAPGCRHFQTLGRCPDCPTNRCDGCGGV